jgi:hypothetical protein
VQNFAQRERNEILSIMQLSRAFGCEPIRAQAALDNKVETPKVCNHHMAVDENAEIDILEWIDVQAEKSNPVTLLNLRHYCEIKYSISNREIFQAEHGLIRGLYVTEMI